ncbi:hypothetical protein L1987_74623 [Smallanthus sonchifolius]|uniref:Uncharacterized protein n=1 Tax=Smallanthus sonchifolius TaxID=185202 RepID=A0ACB9A371_9ASTR|nr:hypothetical protein L1987_74623 [Smallanthus sonchifolius]
MYILLSRAYFSSHRSLFFHLHQPNQILQQKSSSICSITWLGIGWPRLESICLCKFVHVIGNSNHILLESPSNHFAGFNLKAGTNNYSRFMFCRFLKC